MDKDVRRATLDLIRRNKAGEAHPAVLKQLQDEGLVTDAEPPGLTPRGRQDLDKQN